MILPESLKTLQTEGVIPIGTIAIFNNTYIQIFDFIRFIFRIINIRVQIDIKRQILTRQKHLFKIQDKTVFVFQNRIPFLIKDKHNCSKTRDFLFAKIIKRQFMCFLIITAFFVFTNNSINCIRQLFFRIFRKQKSCRRLKEKIGVFCFIYRIFRKKQ